MSDISEIVDNEVPLLKKKEKKPRSEKQIAQFEILKQKRKENIDKKILEKKVEASKLLLSIGEKKVEDEKPVKKEEKKKEEPDSSSSSSEEENKIEKVKKERKDKDGKDKKKKKKKSIKIAKLIMESSSTDDDDSDSSLSDHKPKRNFRTQQNKKSIIKMSREEPQKFNVNKYFLD